MSATRKSKISNFKKQEAYSPRSAKEKRLVKALGNLKNEKDIALFLRDLLTLPEIEEFANRLEIARLLLQGLSYEEISRITGVSTTTVTRVSHWLYNGCGGYQKALKDKTMRA